MKLKAKIIAWLTKDTDLIYTSKGNLPVSDLKMTTEWLFNEHGICLKEIYTLDGEIVKQGVHVYQLPLNTSLKLEQGNL